LPLYAYRCTQCGHRFEKIQNFSAEPELVCPECGGVLVRPLTAPRLHFKGAGWYVNDYAAKSSAPASEGSAEPSNTAAAAEKKAPAPSGDSAAGAPASAPASTPASTSSSAPASTPASSSS